MPFKSPSINDHGIAEFLDLTKERHNDYGFKDFDKMLRAQVNITNIGRAFNVTAQTARHWVRVYQAEVTDKE